MRNSYYSLMALLTLTSCVRAVVFTRCELYHQLLQRDFPEDQLPDWVCLVENESARNTSALSPINTNGSQDFGLFQINNRYWCDSWKGVEGDCHVACKACRTTTSTTTVPAHTSSTRDRASTPGTVGPSAARTRRYQTSPIAECQQLTVAARGIHPATPSLRTGPMPFKEEKKLFSSLQPPP